MICNISKAANVKALIVAAAAHGFVPLLVASDHLSESDCMMLKPSRGGEDHVPTDDSSTVPVIEDVNVYRAATMDALLGFLSTHDVPLVGIEILPDAKSVTADDAFSSTKLALMPGNEGTGMHVAHKAHCSSFVYIPHYGAGGTGSLNVSIAATIVMGCFCEWQEGTKGAAALS